jgi:hypothetical protein
MQRAPRRGARRCTAPRCAAPRREALRPAAAHAERAARPHPRRAGRAEPRGHEAQLPRAQGPHGGGDRGGVPPRAIAAGPGARRARGRPCGGAGGRRGRPRDVHRRGSAAAGRVRAGGALWRTNGPAAAAPARANPLDAGGARSGGARASRGGAARLLVLGAASRRRTGPRGPPCRPRPARVRALDPNTPRHTPPRPAPPRPAPRNPSPPTHSPRARRSCWASASSAAPRTLPITTSPPGWRRRTGR